MLHVACYMLHVAYYMFHVVCYIACYVLYMLHIACYMACCRLHVICHMHVTYYMLDIACYILLVTWHIAMTTTMFVKTFPLHCVKIPFSFPHLEQNNSKMKLGYLFPLVIVQLVLLYDVVHATASVIRQPGNFTVAAFLPIYQSTESHPKDCSNHLDFKRVVETQAIMFAVNAVNLDAGLLNGLTLGYDIETSCGEMPASVFNSVDAMEAKPPSAMLLDLPLLLTKLIAEYQRIPVISLSSIPDDRQGDVFYLEPAQPRSAYAIVKLIQELKWPIVDVLVENAKEYESFKSLIKAAGICVNDVLHSSQNISETVQGRDSKAPLLVFSETPQILKQLHPGILRDREIVLVGDSMYVGKNQSPGTIAVGRKRAKLNQFQDYFLKSAVNNGTWLGGILRNESQGTLPDRLSNELQFAGKAIDAVYVVAHTLTEVQSKQLSAKDLLMVSGFTSPTGNPIRFTASKDLWEVDYEIYDLAKMQNAASIKTFPKNNETTMLNFKNVTWNTEARGHPNASCVTSCPSGITPVPSTEPLAKCCVTCPRTVCEKGRRLDKDGVQCIAVKLDYLLPQHPFSIVIMILVAILFCFLLYLVNLFVKKAHTPTILTTKLATLPLLLSIFATLIVPLLPILKPSTSACNAYVFGYIHGLGIPLCILISRSYSYFQRYRMDDGTLKRKLCHGDPQNVIGVILILIQLLLSLIFLFVYPAHVVHFETDAPDVDYIECSMFSSGEFLAPFFYLILLTIIFSVKNFQAVTREEDIYESNFAALSVFGYYFLSFLTLIVVYGVHGKTKVILFSLITFLHVLNYLLLIFFPKVYVIVFKRDPSSFSPFPLPMVERLEVAEFLIQDEPSKEDPPPS